MPLTNYLGQPIGLNSLGFFSPVAPSAPSPAPPGYIRLPGGDFIPGRIIADLDRCDPAAFDAAVLQNMSYRDKVVTFPAGSNGGAIDYEKVPDGFFWYVLAASIHQFAPSTQGMSAMILLLPPNLGGNLPSLNEVAPDGIEVDFGSPTSVNNVSAGPNAVATIRKVVVPPGWFLRAAISPGSAASVNPVSISFRVAIAQLRLNFANLRG